MEQLKENKRIINRNNDLTEYLLKSNIENEEIKKEYQNNLEEIKNKNLEIIEENNRLSIKVDFLRTKMEKLEKENEIRLKEVKKLRKENGEMNEGNEGLIKEKLNLEEKLKGLKGENEKLRGENEGNLKEKNKLEKVVLNLAEEKMDLIEGNGVKMEEMKRENEGKLGRMREEIQKLIKENVRFLKERENFKVEIAKIKEENNLNKERLNTYEKSFIDNYTKLSRELENSITDLANCKKEVLDLKFVRYVSQKNRINEISEKLTCCENKCINSTISNGTCKAKKGFIRICEGILVKYYLAKENVNNKIICFYAQHPFTKAWGYCCNYSLFYFEVTMIEEAKERTSYVGIGFYNIPTKLSIINNSNNFWNDQNNEVTFHKSSWKDKDVFGCGVVFPSWKDKTGLPYIFFTKNGSRIGEGFLFNLRE
ncbi:unnamed protein product [Meloidogyne enterolobii]|uniref:Uncharacterized protein n=1 Tax=Meloidogyne enterolobii TaxID=390850 RepID=A0ACB1AKR4_MELEN